MSADSDDKHGHDPARVQPGHGPRPGQVSGLTDRPERLPPLERIRDLWWRIMAAGRGSLDPDRLDNWDPDFIRATLPVFAWIRDHYYRAEVRGLERLPDHGPFMLVGMHGGGPMTVLADNLVLFSAYYQHVDVRRPLYAIAHSTGLVLGPISKMMAKFGAVEGKPANARQVLEGGDGLVVYPGGEDDMARTWRDRHRVDFRGRTGFIRTALQKNVPVFPLAMVGGHNTEMVLSEGRRLAEVTRLREWTGIHTMPIALALPWGIVPGYFPYLPLPVRIDIEVGDPMHFHPSEQEYHDPAYWGWMRDAVQAEVQRLVDRVIARRRNRSA